MTTPDWQTTFDVYDEVTQTLLDLIHNCRYEPGSLGTTERLAIMVKLKELVQDGEVPELTQLNANKALAAACGFEWHEVSSGGDDE